MSSLTPLSDCILRHPGSYPWHDVGYHPPKFNDLVLYQLHVGAFYGPIGRAGQIPRCAEKARLSGGAWHKCAATYARRPNANIRSLGYEGAAIFSPEMDYCVADDQELFGYSILSIVCCAQATVAAHTRGSKAADPSAKGARGRVSCLRYRGFVRSRI
jgi:1,4-alpha-glucan branching enzyme